jgi:NAD(P)-dependent dehydrogenase (short-subunit alcohol dehydrogenase family)
MKSILITGGAGDWAQSFYQQFKNAFKISTPSRTELDISNELSVNNYFKSNSFDIVINNAGTIHPKRILESDTHLWINDIQVNLIGSYLTAKAALTKTPDTVIINISSTAAFNAYPDWSSYCASKAGVVTLSKCLAKDGFNSYCLCPGAIMTKFRDKFDLPNDNILTCEDLSKHVLDIIDEKYTSGDILFVRKGEFILNPS